MDREIIWNLVNAGLAGGLVFLGGLSTGNASYETIYIAITAGLVVCVNQFKDYWGKEEKEYCSPKRIGAFINF
ncbi:MAG: hypothetical protein RLY43_1830 [Bacteroidota bacterium]|jgi:hypothetical protein